MTADQWIAAFAREIGMPAPSSEQTALLLELAGVAAHASERTAAPLACWLAGRSGRPPQELLAAARAAGAGSD